MITLTREEAHELLNALTMFCRPNEDQVDELVYEGAIELLSARLSAPEPEPVAWRKKWEGETKWEYYEFDRYQGSEPLYAIQPQREWQSLTDEDLDDAYEAAHKSQSGAVVWSVTKYTEAIEAKLREKNA